ncbi:MAG: SDR family NAD(P)-dependent oxidoreductase [Planctomycetota bacterium]
MSRFNSKRILITGGTSGIGLATAKRLASEGAQVLVTGTNPERVAEAAKLDGIQAVRSDASDPGAAADLAGIVKETLGGLDAAFLNAGFGRFQPLQEITPEEFDAQYHVNVRGPILHPEVLRDGRVQNHRAAF